jgi:hypothetical protein
MIILAGPFSSSYRVHSVIRLKKVLEFRHTVEGVHLMSDLICYCFGYSRQDIEDDFAKNGRSLIMEKIMAEKKAGACDCAKRNPKGR